MKAKIILREPEEMIIHWSHKGVFGDLKFEDIGDGCYKLDAEYLDLDMIFKIIKTLK